MIIKILEIIISQKLKGIVKSGKEKERCNKNDWILKIRFRALNESFFTYVTLHAIGGLQKK